jgi:hypothetical protein
MKGRIYLVVTSLFFVASWASAADIRGITVGDQYSRLEVAFKEGKVLTYDTGPGAELGFRSHTLDATDVVLQGNSDPTGALYHIGFAQLVPFKQADEFKDALCKKYGISPCEWDRSMEKYNPGRTIYQFQGKRTVDGTTITVSISNARKKSQAGFVWAGAAISKGNVLDMVKQWKDKQRQEEISRKEAAARKASGEADRVEMKF